MEAYKFPDETTPIVQEEIEVDIVDDVPEGDRNREALTESPEPDENELASYSDRVKKRIGMLQRAFHDERRAKEQSSRERDEAMSYANNIVAKNKSLVQKSNNDDSLLHETWKSKAESDLDNAKKSYKSAYESGDADAVVDAQEALNRATMRVSQKPAKLRNVLRAGCNHLDYLLPNRRKGTRLDGFGRHCWVNSTLLIRLQNFVKVGNL
jgi:hypothetical protein